MLDEIIEGIGYEKIIDYLKNNISLGNTVLIRINMLDKQFNKNNVLILDKKMQDSEELNNEEYELKKWFQKRLYFCENLGSNKAIVLSGKTSKLITSSIKESIIFNYNTLIKKVNQNYTKVSSETIAAMLNDSIEEYYDALNTKYFENSNEDVLKIKEKLKSFSNDIVNLLIEIEDVKNRKIRILIEADINEYISSNELYLKDKIFDVGTKIKINNVIYGRYSGFITLNSKKPLLKLHGTDEINLITEKQAIEYRNLLMYLTKTNLKEIPFGKGKIKIKFNPKDMVLQNYEMIPYDDEKEEEQLIPYYNVLNLKILDINEEN